MLEQNSLNIKYTVEDIDRIFTERVTVCPRPAALKPGIVCEWGFEYPNGQRTVQVDSAFCIDPKNNNYATGCEVCNEKQALGNLRTIFADYRRKTVRGAIWDFVHFLQFCLSASSCAALSLGLGGWF